jgi:hypothetical protein
MKATIGLGWWQVEWLAFQRRLARRLHWTKKALLHPIHKEEVKLFTDVFMMLGVVATGWLFVIFAYITR